MFSPRNVELEMAGSSQNFESQNQGLARLLPALLAGAGVMGSALLLWSLRSGEIDGARADFERFASDRVAAVSSRLTASLEGVHSTVALFDSSEEVLVEEFRTFTSGMLARYPPLRAIVWIVRDSSGETVRHVVRYSEGIEAASLPQGSVLGSRVPLPQRVDGSLGLSPPFELDLDERDGGRLRVLATVAVLDRAGDVVGLVGGLLDAQELFRDERAASDFLLEDITASSPALLVGRSDPGELVHSTELEHGGRRWRLQYFGPDGFIAARTSAKPWIVFLLGVLATGLLVATVAIATGRARIQRLVERRTKEVMASYDTLAHEAQERLWAVAESGRLEQRMREIIDLVPDMIYVKDWYGRMLLANLATAEALGTTVTALTRPGDIDFLGDVTDPDAQLLEERELIRTGTSSIIRALPFVHAQLGRRILHVTKIPCDVFGEDRRALLCVARDITERMHAETILSSQNRILGELASGATPKKVLRDLVGAAEEIVQGLRASVLLLAPGGRVLRHGCAPSLPDFYNEAIDGLEIGPMVGSCGAAAATGERTVVEDVMEHPNWAPYRELAERAKVRACWSQPIRSSTGEILGTFAMYYSEPRHPERFELELSESMAHLAGIAIERGGVLESIS